MKINKSIVLIVVVWFLAMISIIAVPKTINYMRRIKAKRTISVRDAKRKAYEAEFEALSENQKQAVLRYECGLIQISNDRFYLVGKNYENNEISLAEKNMILHFRLDNSAIEEKDPIHLVRRDEVSQIFSSLNDAQKRLIIDLKAIILRADDGQYFMVADRNSMNEYVLKYGVECSKCPKKSRKRTEEKIKKE
jgi:NADH:ubiquinone oxidoreductase subunit 3 (subunit A)